MTLMSLAAPPANVCSHYRCLGKWVQITLFLAFPSTLLHIFIYLFWHHHVLKSTISLLVVELLHIYIITIFQWSGSGNGIIHLNLINWSPSITGFSPCPVCPQCISHHFWWGYSNLLEFLLFLLDNSAMLE